MNLELGAGLLLNGQTIALVAFCTLAWGLFDVSRKRLMADLSPQAAAVALMLWQSPIFAVFGIASANPGWAPIMAYWPPAFLSIFLNSLGHLFFLESVSRAPLSIVIPILSLTPVFSSIGGFLVFNEMPTFTQRVGIMIIVVGAVGFGWIGVKGPSNKASGTRIGILLMVVVSVLWAITPVVDKFCLKFVSPAVHSFYQCLGVGALLLAFFGARNRDLSWIKSISPRHKWLWAAGLFAAAALGSQMVAITMMPVGIFEACKRALGIVLAILLGRLFFGEPMTSSKILFGLVMALGFVLLF